MYFLSMAAETHINKIYFISCVQSHIKNWGILIFLYREPTIDAGALVSLIIKFLLMFLQALISAAREGDVQKCKNLIAEGADVNYSDEVRMLD